MALVRFLEDNEELPREQYDLKDDLPPLNWSPDTLLEKLPNKSGLFRIYWNPEADLASLHFPRSIRVAYRSKRRPIEVTCFQDDILYIGKSRLIKSRVKCILSQNVSTNLVAQKIALLLGVSTSLEKPVLDEIKSLLAFNYILEPHPIKRDFMKAAAVGYIRPCLNIGLEH